MRTGSVPLYSERQYCKCCLFPLNSTVLLFLTDGGDLLLVSAAQDTLIRGWIISPEVSKDQSIKSISIANTFLCAYVSLAPPTRRDSPSKQTGPKFRHYTHNSHNSTDTVTSSQVGRPILSANFWCLPRWPRRQNFKIYSH